MGRGGGRMEHRERTKTLELWPWLRPEEAGDGWPNTGPLVENSKDAQNLTLWQGQCWALGTQKGVTRIPTSKNSVLWGRQTRHKLLSNNIRHMWQQKDVVGNRKVFQNFTAMVQIPALLFTSFVVGKVEAQLDWKLVESRHYMSYTFLDAQCASPESGIAIIITKEY